MDIVAQYTPGNWINKTFCYSGLGTGLYYFSAKQTGLDLYWIHANILINVSWIFFILNA